MTPSVLLPYQQRWMSDTSPVRVAEKSRRIGWSWTCACEAALEASRTSGADTWYVGYNHDMAQEFIRDAAFWARAFANVATAVEQSIFEDDDPDRNIMAYTIRFATGYRVTALSSRPTNLRGKRGRIILDEAAFHDDLDGLLKAALAVLMWGGNARVDIISTHNGVDNDFNKLVEEIRAGKRPYTLHRCTIDDALADGLYKRICLVNNLEWSAGAETRWRADLFARYGDAADEELLCVPARSGGTYLTRDLLERQMVAAPVVRLALGDEFLHWTEAARVGHVDQWLAEQVASHLAKLDAQRLHFFGEDFGRVSDRTCVVIGHLAQDLVRKTDLVVELLNVPYDQQRQIVFYIADRLPRFIGGAVDATGNGGYIAEACVTRYGTVIDKEQKRVPRVRPVTLTDKWYAENLPPLKAALEDRQLELARDADHMLDLSAFKVVNGLPRLPKAKTPSATETTPRHGDAAIAYALAYFASRLPVAEYAYEPAARVVQSSNVHRLHNAPSAEQTRISRETGVRLKRGGIL